jgi:L-aminopeptidase/D-esterase-like protein
MRGLRVGHYTDTVNGTGLSVFLFNPEAVGTYHLCGASPASHELGTLELDANVTHLDGLAFLGGSAFGLGAVSGVMRWFAEQQRGWKTSHGTIPIVPAAAIYDLAVKQVCVPTPEHAYQACQLATENNKLSGNVGAGTGASVGKLIHSATCMSGGMGYAEMIFPNDVRVIVYVVVNSVGDIRDATGTIIAGARSLRGEFIDCEKTLLMGQNEQSLATANTTLVGIFTDAKFSKVELKRIAKMATAGMARAISPIFSRYDGDIIFAVSLGEKSTSELVIATAAAHLTQQAIMNAVKDSKVL